ncbi:hypothetical protein NEIELOOT_01277 [Neisseria elongata subsp. glycolytica ATCC 29315]|uniref:Uncharacterized protein n=1 Tax=Neisseria elongata subsp. glycolytica ATCC 29315 TaxID=546263 RepID=D4DQE0_NEIEG|nr:hypothetical protein NEIELOOT_01277 [Neisseria elongata subsp. glycolytica ATCC 29315]
MIRGRQYAKNTVSIHSRPKAAATFSPAVGLLFCVSIHSRPKAAVRIIGSRAWLTLFQYTAARRRLEPLLKALFRQVSQPRFR